MKTFREISDSYDCDKTTYHAYDQIYPLYLETRRRDSLRLLEIGLDEGKSIKLWKEYLPSAVIIGADIHDKSHLGADEFYQVDQSSEQAVRHLAKQVGSVDVIVDDGSHVIPHQITTFEVLFAEALVPGGVYIIEDVECSYWKAGSDLYGYKTGGESIFDYFADVPHVVNAHVTRRDNRLGIKSVAYHENAVVVCKQTVEDAEKAGRDYRFAHFL